MEQLRFDGKVAIVTGAARGLGREYATLLAQRGAAVVVNDLGGELDGSDPRTQPAEDVASEIRANGGQAVANSDSVATEKGAAAIVQCALDAFGGVNIVINNAGVHVVRPFTGITRELYQLHLDVHLGGTFFVTQLAWTQLAATGGSVVNTTSNAILGLPGLGAYGPAKAGIFGLTRTLAIEGREFGIRVNAISPAATTRMVKDGQSSLSLASDVVDNLNAIGPPRYAAAVVAYLAHDSCLCTGEVISAGRGRIRRIVLAETPGIEVDDLSPEYVAASIGEILDDTVLTTQPDGLAYMARAGRTTKE
jgi:NAD(P)-dependent dehydrogenase (short-subunit alcohol dehydrogenase family)